MNGRHLRSSGIYSCISQAHKSTITERRERNKFKPIAEHLMMPPTGVGAANRMSSLGLLTFFHPLVQRTEAVKAVLGQNRPVLHPSDDLLDPCQRTEDPGGQDSQGVKADPLDPLVQRTEVAMAVKRVKTVKAGRRVNTAMTAKTVMQVTAPPMPVHSNIFQNDQRPNSHLEPRMLVLPIEGACTGVFQSESLSPETRRNSILWRAAKLRRRVSESLTAGSWPWAGLRVENFIRGYTKCEAMSSAF